MPFFSKLFGHSDLIYIHSDKQQYYAGEVVTGQIILSVVTPLHVDGIFMKLSGCEETEFDVTRTKTTTVNGKSETTTYKKRVSAKNTFFKRRYCIYQQKCTFAPGNFVFPFQFQLDNNLPGTFEISNPGHFMQHANANVTYKIGAEVVVPGRLTPNLRHEQEVIICERLRAALMSSDTHKESKVTFLCCIPKGTVTMSASIDKNAYASGDTVQLRLIVDNSQSKVDLESFSLRLTCSLNLRAGEDKCSSGGTTAKAQSPGVKAGDRVERFIQLSLPTDTEPSTSSRLIDCSYYLSVSLKVPWSPDITIKQPVQVFAPIRVTYIPHLEYPYGWAPSVLPMSDLKDMQYATY